MGGPNLEVFKFGMYIMFPIGFMYYFGVNLDSRFAVPDFWPKKGQTHEIPFEREEITEELERLKQRRLAVRARRMAIEGSENSSAAATDRSWEGQGSNPGILEAVRNAQSEGQQAPQPKGWFSWMR